MGLAPGTFGRFKTAKGRSMSGLSEVGAGDED